MDDPNEIRDALVAVAELVHGVLVEVSTAESPVAAADELANQILARRPCPVCGELGEWVRRGMHWEPSCAEAVPLIARGFEL